MMKYLFLLVALFGAMNLHPCHAVLPDNQEDDDPQHIQLEAETEDERAKTLSVPFEAWLSNGTVTVVALTTVEPCTFGVCTASGTVVTETVSAVCAGQQVTLPMTGMEKGTYTLYITTGQGVYIYGTFVL